MDGELLSLKWNNHRSTFYHIISGLRNKESYTDVTIACDGKFYPAHKFVLSTCSDYFVDIFQRTTCKNPVVVLKDIQHRDLEFLLDYMYIGEVNVRQNELTSLIKAAECLRVKGLAVPDEEPKKSTSANSVPSTVTPNSRQRPEQSSPPAKRRRAEERQGNTSLVTDHGPGRPTGDGIHATPERSRTQPISSDIIKGLDYAGDAQGDNSETIVIKEEKEDNEENATSLHSNFDEGEGGGDGEVNQSENTSASDFPEFLQSTIEKEEPVAISEFNPSEFPGPSGLQNSTLAPWESENSSTGFPEALAGAAVSQPQQRQQQQLYLQWLDELRKIGSMKDAKDKLTCPLCGKVCSRSDKLKLHLRTHTGERPYRCSFCSHRSRTSDDLKRHVRTHTGERPYQCPYCPYKASDPSTIRSHKKHRHHDLFYQDKLLKQIEKDKLEQQQNPPQ